MSAIIIQFAFLLAGAATLFIAITATDGPRRQAGMAVFSILLAGSTLAQALASQARARSDALAKMADLDKIVAIGPGALQAEGLGLVRSAVESDIRLGLGSGVTVLLIMGGALLGMGVAQLLALWRSRGAGSPAKPTGVDAVMADERG